MSMQKSRFLNYLQKLYLERRELSILELAYLVISLFSFVVAAIIALLNQSLGVALLIIPCISCLAFSANIIVWSLIKMFIEELDKRGVSTKKSSVNSARLNTKTKNRNKTKDKK